MIAWRMIENKSGFSSNTAVLRDGSSLVIWYSTGPPRTDCAATLIAYTAFRSSRSLQFGLASLAAR